ncbi:proline-rich basic protein 1 [Monodelphis domestica]|uniref:Proline rich basic protein 1 n=1 Tax=Monodelphis domestica TaxID=13616 RepID=A0A5F8GYL2_MONDO|nr:proline-rich basic protein 1 [Monodelphis domestica]
MLSILVPPAAGGFPPALALRQDSSGSSGSYHTAPGSPEPQGPRPVLDGADDDDGGSGVPGRGQPAKFAGLYARVSGRGAGPAGSGGSQLRLSISAQNSRQEPGSGFSKRPGPRPSPSPFQLRTLPSGEMEVIFTTGPLGGTPVQAPSDSDEADSEVQQLTGLSFHSLTRPQGPYLDVHSPSARASSSPSPAPSDSSNQADRWATYLDLHQEAEASAPGLPELPAPSGRTQFECVEVALEDQASLTKQRTVPKRQIELRRKPSPPELDAARANALPRHKLFMRTGSLDESLTRLQAASNLVQTALARKLQAEQTLRLEQQTPRGGAQPIQTLPGPRLSADCNTQKPADWPQAWPEAREREAPTRRTVRSPRRDSKDLKNRGTSQTGLPPREPAKEAPLPPVKPVGLRAPEGVVSIRVPRPWPSLRERAIRRDKPAPGTEPLGPVSSSIFLLSGEKSHEASESPPRNELGQRQKSLSPKRTSEDPVTQETPSPSPQETPSPSPQETWDPTVQASLIPSMPEAPNEALQETPSTQSNRDLTVKGSQTSPTLEPAVPDTWEPRDAPAPAGRSRVTVPRPRDVRKLVKNTYSLSFPAATSTSLGLPEPPGAPGGPSEESEAPPGAPEPPVPVHYTSTFQKDFLPIVPHPYEVPEQPGTGGAGASDWAPFSHSEAPRSHQPQPQPKGYSEGDLTPQRKAENCTAKPFARSEIRLPGALSLSRKLEGASRVRAQPETSTEISRASPGYSPQAQIQRLLPEGEVQANPPGVKLGLPIPKEPRDPPEVETQHPPQWGGTGQASNSLTGSPHPNLRGSLHLGSPHPDPASSQNPEPRAKPQPGFAGIHPSGNQITAKPASLSQPRAASAPPLAQVLDSPSQGQGRGLRSSGSTPSGKVLVDPESGRYYYVEAPKSPRLKLLFDPESGQYLEVLVPPSPAGAPVRFYPSVSLGPSLYPPYGSYPGLSLPPSPGPLPLGPPDLLAPGAKLPWAPEGGTVDGLYYLPTGSSPSPLPGLPLLLYSGPPNSGSSTTTKGSPF